MKNSLRLVGAALVLATSAPALVAALPTFTGTSPTGVQRGVETNLTIRGTRLADFDGLIFYSPGFALKSVGKVENGSVETVVTVAPDVPLGNHFVRVRTRTGLSFMRQIMVGPFASVQEKEPNNDFDVPQEITLNQTVEGVAATEDVDYYRIAAKKGQRISLEIEAMRLGYITFDPYIALMNSDRFEVAVSDDTVLHRQDGHLTFVAPEDGNYTIQVRESSYRGNGDSRYRLHVGSFRRPEVCYPSGGKAGSTQKVKFIEANGDVTEEDVALPAETSDKHMVYLKDDPAPSGNIMRVSPFDSYLEVEPNDKEANRTNLEAPCALNGIIEKPGDEDRFWVNLKKGMKVDFFAYAQSLGSPLDPVMVLTNEKGNQIGAADDGGTKRRLDCKLSVTAPADGAYCVIIRDHLQRGGPTYVYRVEAVASVPLVTFASPNFGVNDSHKRQFIAVPRGNRYATMVNVTRNNASGDMTFEAPNLPPGVKLVSTNMPGNQTSVPLLFEATADAPLGGAAVPVTLKPVDPAQKVEGRMAQEFDMVRSGNTIYYTEQVDQLPVAVVEEVPYTLELIKPATPLVPNGLLPLKVVAKRKEGFKASIRVLMLWRPNGINSQGEIDIPEGQNEAAFTLDSTGNVSPGTYNLTVLGEAEGGNGTIYAASPFCEVTVVPAYLSGSMQLTAVEQGKEGEFVCKLEQALPFDGEASAKIYGIPDSVEVETLKFNKDAKELTFKIKTTDKSPVGKHANLFCQVEVPVQGGVAVHRIAGGTTLRVDAPRKAPAAPVKPAAQVAAAKPAAPAADAPKKQLSRLEQLRQEAAAK